MCGRSFRIQIASRFVKSSPQKHSAITHLYWFTISMPDRKHCYRNTSRQSPTAMERQAQLFLAMLGLLVTRALCNELVKKKNNLLIIFIILCKNILANGPILQENEIWNVIIQLTCGLRAIHQANLACRFVRAEWLIDFY